jgi:hypothetical protein
MTGAARHAISICMRAPCAAVKKIPSQSVRFIFYWETPPV